jgi:hypothetical protein
MSDTDERAQGAVIAPVLGEDEQGELERLRQEVAALRATAVPRLVAAFAGRRSRLLSCWCWGAWVSRPRWSRCGRTTMWPIPTASWRR